MIRFQNDMFVQNCFDANRYHVSFWQDFLLGWNLEIYGIQKALQGFFVTASENRTASNLVLNQ